MRKPIQNKPADLFSFMKLLDPKKFRSYFKFKEKFVDLEPEKSELDKVHEELFDNPFVTNIEYGRLAQEADEADERRSWEKERDDDV